MVDFNPRTMGSLAGWRGRGSRGYVTEGRKGTLLSCCPHQGVGMWQAAWGSLSQALLTTRIYHCWF